MSFEQMDKMELENKHNRSCVIIINFEKKELVKLRNVISMLGIKDQIILDSKNGESLVRDILDNKINEICENGNRKKALLFNNMTNNKVNAVLDSLKKIRINRPLSALVTETSIGWTLNNLLKNLDEEREAMKKGVILKH